MHPSEPRKKGHSSRKRSKKGHSSSKRSSLWTQCLKFICETRMYYISSNSRDNGEASSSSSLNRVLGWLEIKSGTSSSWIDSSLTIPDRVWLAMPELQLELKICEPDQVRLEHILKSYPDITINTYQYYIKVIYYDT